MMRKLILAIAALTLLFSCGTSRVAVSEEEKEQKVIDSLVLIRPWTNIAFLDGEGKFHHNDSLSRVSESVLVPVLQNSEFPIKHYLDIDYSEKNTELRKYLNWSIRASAEQAMQVALTDSICNLVLSCGYRYGLVLISTGFERDKKSQKKKMAGAIGMGILTGVLTLGTVSAYYVPYRHGSNIFLSVIDAQEKRVLLLAKNTPNDYSPFEQRYLEDQVQTLYRSYVKAKL